MKIKRGTCWGGGGGISNHSKNAIPTIIRLLTSRIFDISIIKAIRIDTRIVIDELSNRLVIFYVNS